MKTELTCEDMSMLQDALAYKLLYLKEYGLRTAGLVRCDTLEIMRLAAKLEVLKKEKYEESLRTK